MSKHTEHLLAVAVDKHTDARARMSAAKPGSRQWRDAEEDLNFWQGKVANMTKAVAKAAE